MSIAAADAVPVSASGPRRQLRDFSDRLSPMLVKELRQGLKSPVFTLGLIAMQTVLMIMTAVAMSEGNVMASSRAFWWSAAALICLLLPLRVTNALRDEMGGNTMDMLVLTRLSAWRITLGKWLAASALQILVAVTLLPYLIMRYFAGGVNLPMELAWLGVLVLFSLLVTAIMLGLSWFRYFLVRALVMLGVLYGTAAACTGIIYMIERSGRYGMTQRLLNYGWPGFLWLLTIAAWLAFFFLDLGAARIAPLSENRSTRRRLVGVATLIAGGVCCALMKEPPLALPLVVSLTTVAGMVCVQALSEVPNNLSPVLQPFVQRGRMGRLAGRLLYPGWHSGLFFTLLVMGVSIGAAWVFYYLQQQAFLKTILSGPPGYFRGSGLRSYDGTGPYFALLGQSGDWHYIGLMRWIMLFAGTIGALILPVVLWRIIVGMKRWSFWHWLGLVVCGGLVHWLVINTTISYGMRAATVLTLPTGGAAAPFIALAEADEQSADLILSGWRSSEEWEYLKRVEVHAQMSIASVFSAGAWLTFAVAFALSELRKTRRAEDELVRAVAASRLPGAGSTNMLAGNPL